MPVSSPKPVLCSCCSSPSTKNSKSRYLKPVGGPNTANKNLTVLACEFCDGAEIFKIAKSSNG